MMNTDSKENLAQSNGNMPLQNDVADFPKAIIFDLDGTFYSKHRLGFWFKLYNPLHLRYLKAQGACYRALIGYFNESGDSVQPLVYQWMALYLHTTKEKVQRWYEERYQPSFLRILEKHYNPRPWVLPMLEKCRKEGIKMSVLSDFGQVSERLRALGIDPSQFVAVVSTPSVGGFKPCVKPLLDMAAQMGVAPEETLVIGDRRSKDGESATRAGMPFWWVNPHSPATPSEIVAFLDK